MVHIPISKDLIPYTFNIMLFNEAFDIRVDYNYTADLFTLSLSKGGTVLCDGEPLIYGKPLFADLLNRGGYPLVIIEPIDESERTCAVTFDNLGRTVFLRVVDRP